VNDDLIKRLRIGVLPEAGWIELMDEAADALEAAHQREVAATRRFDTLQQRIEELEQRIRKMRPYDGQFMSVQEHDDICDAQYLAGLREALEAVKEVWLSNDYPTVGECVDTLQALIDAATADPACKSPESDGPSPQG
jgi:hypothetical protein